jgi:REP element-mobilizing transposase RayT
MPRPPRDKAPGIFHITAHSVRSTDLFVDDIDRLVFLEELARTCALLDWTCIGFCLLDTHYHLLVETRDESLSYGMQQINFRHARRLNARHLMRGHAFDRRFWSKRTLDEAHLLTRYRYVMRNPVTAGLCARPADWPWSSYRALFDDRIFTFVDPSAVLACLDPSRERAIEKLRALVEAEW